MNDFAGMEELLQDYLLEATEILSDVDNKLVDLERYPGDPGLLNEIFRGFHTIKGGAGFLAATELVTLCHLTENLFDRLRNGEIELTPEIMDVIMLATANVRAMFSDLHQSIQPAPAPNELLQALKDAALNKPVSLVSPSEQSITIDGTATASSTEDSQLTSNEGEPDWAAYQASLENGATAAQAPAPGKPGLPVPQKTAGKPFGRRGTDQSPNAYPAGRRDQDRTPKEQTIRIDTPRLDQVITLSGEIGLVKNRLNSLRVDILSGKRDSETLRALDEATSQLDLLVSDLQNSVMKIRMQPIGRLFQKYPRLARDLARQLGKEVELVIEGEETEIDKTMIDDLNDPLVHLVRNSVDHGIESPSDRLANGKMAKGIVKLAARQEGDHIIIEITDDGRGMSAEKMRNKALEKGVISEEEANILDERQSLNLVFLPGFSTAETVSDVSGRGVGMDVVKTNIQKLNGDITLRSELGKGSSVIISLPLTLAILPVLVVLLKEQPFAVPLSMVREILTIEPDTLQEVGGKTTMVLRGEVLPVVSLSRLIGWQEETAPRFGVLMTFADNSFVIGVDSFAGREDAVIKSLEDFKPRGIAGVTTASNGQIVLILDMKELFADIGKRMSRSTTWQPAKKELSPGAQAEKPKGVAPLSV